MEKLIKSVIFLVIGIALFAVVQDVLTPDPASAENRKYQIESISLLEDDTIDVLFLGTSHPEYGISPMRIYENTQIRSYNLGTSAQPIECSYFLLKYVFQTQNPQIVMLDCSGLFNKDYGTAATYSDAWWRGVLDNMPFSSLKWEMAKVYGEKDFGSGVLSAMFPIIRYHTRWSQLRSSDFKLSFLSKTDSPYYSAGQCLSNDVVSSLTTISEANYIANVMVKNSQGWTEYYQNDAVQEQDVEGILYNPTVSANELAYLLKIQGLCYERGAKLVLIKVPSLYFPQLQSGAWTEIASERAAEVASQYNIPYYDLMYGATGIVDFNTDTQDGGWHLNFRGAEKVSDALSSILTEDYHCVGGSNAQFNKMLADYKKTRETAKLSSERNFYNYIDCLAEHKDDWNIFISVSEEYTYKMTEADYDFLQEKLGLQLIAKGEFSNSYMAVIERGSLLHEELSNRKIEQTMEVDGHTVRLVSSGWYYVPTVSIKIDGREYTQSGRGIHFVVYDNESELVIDNVRFDTYQESKPAFRNRGVPVSYLRAYESAVCFD